MKMFKMFFALSFLTASATTHAALINVNMDGAALTSNGTTYFIDPTVWTGDFEVYTSAQYGSTGNMIFSVAPEFVGHPTAVNDFNMIFYFEGLDGINTFGGMAAMEYTVDYYNGIYGNTSTIPNTDFGFSLGHTSGTWDWVDYDLIFNLDYEVPIDPFNLALGSNNYGSYSFTVENYFETSNPSPVPVPAAVWLFASGLLGLTAVARRKTNQVA